MKTREWLMSEKNLLYEDVDSFEGLSPQEKENLKLVMKEVKKLFDELHGKVVITSDHGNHLGEYRVFGHMKGLRTKQLVKVPWLVVKDEEKEVVPCMHKDPRRV